MNAASLGADLRQRVTIEIIGNTIDLQKVRQIEGLRGSALRQGITHMMITPLAPLNLDPSCPAELSPSVIVAIQAPSRKLEPAKEAIELVLKNHGVDAAVIPFAEDLPHLANAYMRGLMSAEEVDQANAFASRFVAAGSSRERG